MTPGTEVRAQVGGVFIVIMVLLTLVSDIAEPVVPLWIAGLIGWCAVFLLFPGVKKSQLYQTAAITVWPG